MPLVFNSSHPLAGNVTAMIAVEDGVLTEIKNRTLGISVHGSASYGTGTYGAHLRTSGLGYTRYGATFTGGITIPTATTGATVLIVLNAVHQIWGGSGSFFDMAGAGSPPNIRFDPVAPGQGDNLPFGTGTLSAGAGASMMTVTRAAGDASAIIAYLNGSQSVATTCGYSSASGGIAGIGGNGSGAAIDASMVYLVVFDRVLTPTEISDLYASLGASNTFALLGSADVIPPVLTTPVGTSTGPSTATVGATTDEGNGTMYAVVTTSATQPSVAQIKAGQTHTGAAAPWGGSVAVSSTGAKTLNATGLTASTTYYGHVVHTDAATNDSNRVSSSSFTTSSVATITTQAFKNNTGSLLASTTIDNVVVLRASNRTLTLALTAQTTDGSGVLTVADAALTTGIDYLVVSWNTGLTAWGCEVYTAS